MTHPALPDDLPARRGAHVEYRPDWMIIGVRQGPGGVMLFASNHLVDVVLEPERDETVYRQWMADAGLLEEPPLDLQMIKFTARGKRYVMVIGRDYEEALRHLFATWSPTPEQGELPRGG